MPAKTFMARARARKREGASERERRREGRRNGGRDEALTRQQSSTGKHLGGTLSCERDPSFARLSASLSQHGFARSSVSLFFNLRVEGFAVLQAGGRGRILLGGTTHPESCMQVYNIAEVIMQAHSVCMCATGSSHNARARATFGSSNTCTSRPCLPTL
jgi:hypothetical protein